MDGLIVSKGLTVVNEQRNCAFILSSSVRNESLHIQEGRDQGSDQKEFFTHLEGNCDTPYAISYLLLANSYLAYIFDVSALVESKREGDEGRVDTLH